MPTALEDNVHIQKGLLLLLEVAPLYLPNCSML